MATPRKRPEDFHKMGRPTKYTPEMCDRIMSEMSEGQSVYEAARSIGVNVDTIWEWAKVHPDFSDALKRASRASRGWWEAKARENLENPKFQAGLWFMNMKNRFGRMDPGADFAWADKHEVAGDGGGPLSIVWGGDPVAAAK